MRDRLIELLTDNLPKADNPLQFVSDELVERLVDYLLENGVIVPPCKIGDTVYEVVKSRKGDYSHINTSTCIGFHIVNAPKKRGHTRHSYIVVHYSATNSTRHFSFDKIGKTVFFAKEEAEQVLKGGANNA